MENVGQPQLRNPEFWKRALYMIAFAIAYSIAELVVLLVVVMQFLTILFTGRASEPLLQFGSSLADYVRQILHFVLYNSEQMPFPFADWPQPPAGGERWLRTSDLPPEPSVDDTVKPV